MGYKKVEKARITGMVNEALQLMGIDKEYEITLVFDTGLDGDTAGDQVYPTAACTTASWKYKRARIRFYLDMCASVPDDRLFAIIVHELVHVLLHPLDSLIPNNEHDHELDRAEYTTECVARVILHAAGRTYGGVAE